MKKGISLIVLIITIIVVIVLAGAIILNLSKNSPINTANEAVFKQDIGTFKSELLVYKVNQYSNSAGLYDEKKLFADSTSLIYNGQTLEGNISTIIKEIERKYPNEFQIREGKLEYKGQNEQKRSLAQDLMVPVVGEKPIVNISTTQTLPVKQGMLVKYVSEFTSDVAISNISLEGKIKIVDSQGVELATQPSITIGTPSGTDADKVRTVEITINTTGIAEGKYKVEVLSGAVTNVNNISNANKVSSMEFEIDNMAPSMPNFTTNKDLTNWVIGSVEVTIVPSSINDSIKYSIDGTTYYDYTGPITVETNLTVYAKEIDLATNESEIATLEITKIDNLVPQDATINVAAAGAMINGTITVIDNQGGIDISKCKYIVTIQSSLYTNTDTIWDTATSFTTSPQSILKNALRMGNNYVQVLSVDKAGNKKVNISSAISVAEVVVSSPQTVNKTFLGATTGFSYNNPVIPAGFVAVNTSAATWSNYATSYNAGLVIQDAVGNQFVWVPINGSSVTYAKWCTTNISYTLTSDIIPSGFNETGIRTTYKGFYVGRYEAGFDYNNGNIRAASKKSANVTEGNWSNVRTNVFNGYLWNIITYADAKKYSEAMATSCGYTTVGSNLITGTEWDTLMKWIQSSGKIVTDSTTWGNHSNSVSPANVPGYGSLKVSGYSEQWKANNIYDLAGNLHEWTGETYNGYIIRGGDYINTGNNFSAACRCSAPGTYSSNYGFRVALYLK